MRGLIRAHLATAMALLLAVATHGRAGVIVRVIPQTTTPTLGALFSVDLVADMTEPVLGWGLDLEYEAAALTPVGTPAIGPLWLGGFASDGDGLAGIAFPSAITGSDILLARLNLLPIRPGLSQISPAITPGDLNEGFPLDPFGFAPVVFEPATLTIIPEPMTGVSLAGLVLLWLTGFRSRLRP